MMKKNHNQSLTKRSDFMKNTPFKVGEVFDDILQADCVSQGQSIQHVFFSAKYM